ncbi:MAG: aminodeoxychorismate synthase component I [Desulfopila sp.]
MKTITYNTLKALLQFLRGCNNYVFLDTSKPDDTNSRSLLFLDPLERLRLYHGEDENVFFERLLQLQRRGYYVAGWFGYEFGYLLEPRLKEKLTRKSDQGMVLADLGVFASCYSYNHHSGQHDFPLASAAGRLPAYRIDNLHTSQTEKQYTEALAEILAYIGAGETYQVNYTLKLFFDFYGSAERFYSDLRYNQSVGYGALIRWRNQHILSFSPELFFWKHGEEVMVRPMKGTVKRGRTIDEDGRNRDFLCSDIKNRSENVMIVDLLRNDLGRLMHQLPGGDVRVDSLFDVETYETLLQMTSTIRAQSSRKSLEEVSLHDLFRAIFPCGSVTGAPKIRTMEIIDELECERRGVYTGAIGCMLPQGEAVFNVPIRTIVLDGERGQMGIGSGIVYDSDPYQEWRECLLKGRFLTEPQPRFQLIETILWYSCQGLFLLDEHLERLQASAAYFLFRCECTEILRALHNRAAHCQGGAKRLRLLLEKDGTFDIEVQECTPPISLYLPEQPSLQEQNLPCVALSGSRVDSKSRWQYHKTTIRALYNQEYARAMEHGLLDTLFFNEDGHLTEGCISNVVLYRAGAYQTPPVADGLLPGVMRRYLLEQGAVPIEQRSLTFDDLRQAEALFLCNSVRGVVQVTLQLSM